MISLRGVVSLTDILLFVIAVFTVMNWMEHSQRWMNGKKRYGKYKYKVIKFIKRAK